MRLPLPPVAQIEPVGPAAAPVLISWAAFRDLLDAQPGLKELQLQGAGDPFAHPRFFDMVTYAAARGVEVTTTSRLLALSEARVEECVASGLRRLDVAPPASSAADCDYLASGSKLRRALRNLRRLATARSRKGVHLPEIRVVLILQRRHLGALEELVRLVRAHGADALVFQHLWHDVSPARRFVEAESLLREDPARLASFFEQAQKVGLELALPRSRSYSGPCEQPWRRLHIGPRGEALPCAKLKTAQRLDLGNMRADGVVRVWNNVAYREFRRRLASDEPPSVCRSCLIYSVKRPGARALPAAPAAAALP